jgi:crossover junction endodeoxyribonuclease RuvC
MTIATAERGESALRVIGIDPSFRACGLSDGTHHFIVKTLPEDSDATQAASITRRCNLIIEAAGDWLNAYHRGEKVALYIEAPAFGQASQASHLYELGWLMYHLHSTLARMVAGEVVKVVEVSTTALRKWATGKGNTPKDSMKLAVFKKFGVEFDQDPGCDKLFAFLLCKYGEAVERGEITFAASAKRGAKHRKREAV